MEINLDGTTKIVPANKLQGAGPGKGQRIDFARDTVLVICPTTHRALAVCKPLPGAQSVPHEPPPRRESPASPPPDGANLRGPLTPAQQEQLQRIWLANPKASVSDVAEKMLAATGREVSAMTVAKYRPGG